MALTPEQEARLKTMIKLIFRADENFAVDRLVLLLTDAQKDQAYDALRNRVIQKLDERITAAQDRLTAAQNDKNDFPSRV